MLTIAEPAADPSLLTLAEIREALGGPVVSADRLERLGRAVAATIARCCRVAAAGAATPTLRAERLVQTFRLKSEQDQIVLARRPVTVVASILESGKSLEQGTDYDCDASAGLLVRLSAGAEACWPCAIIAVEYTAGWPTVPADLKLAASKLAAVLWSEGEKVDPGLRRESIPGLIDREWWVGPSSDPAIPQEVMDLLRPYQNAWIG